MSSGHTRGVPRWLAVTSLFLVVFLTACSGPDEFGDAIPTATATPEPTATATATPTEEPEPTATVEPTATTEPTAGATATESAEPEPTPSPTTEPEPTADEPAPTEEPEPTPSPSNPMDALPMLDELTDAGFIVADDGERSAEQLAQSYIDPQAHLDRLESWGFTQHVFREFSRQSAGEDDPVPTYVLATVNVYGSPEQVAEAMQWLESSRTNQGGSIVERPELGDSAVALTQATVEGDIAGWVFFGYGDRVYIYYTQGTDPLPEALSIAHRVWERIATPAGE